MNAPQEHNNNAESLAPGTARETLDALTDEQRADLFAEYCVFCGSKNKPCTCMNDE
jgi:hypothetical protein